MSLVWEDPPPAKGRTSFPRSTRWDELAQVLRERPGAWLRVEVGMREKDAATMRSGLRCRGLEVAMRHLEDGFGVWARVPE